MLWDLLQRLGSVRSAHQGRSRLGQQVPTLTDSQNLRSYPFYESRFRSPLSFTVWNEWVDIGVQRGRTGSEYSRVIRLGVWERYCLMVRKSKRRRKVISEKREVKLPLGTFEEWMRVQAVKPAVTIPEVDVPLDSYEAWIRKQTRKQ